MNDNPILVKSFAFAFALRIVKLSRHLADEYKEFTLSRELLSSGTNIGRFVKEAISAESSDSFSSLMGRALRNADVTEYWLLLIRFAELLNDREFASIETDRKELAKMLTKIVKTSRGE